MFEIIFTAFLCGLTLYLLRGISLAARKRYPPGPWGFPVIGHLPLFGRLPTETFLQWRHSYGDIFRIRMGAWPAVVVNGYSAVKDAADKPGDVFSGRPDFVTNKALREAFNGDDPLAFANFSPRYLQHRKFTVAALAMYMKRCDFESLFIEESDRFVRILVKDSKLCELDIGLYAYRAIARVLYQVLYGVEKSAEFEKILNEIVESTLNFNKFVGAGNPVDVIPWLRYILPYKVKEFMNVALELKWITKRNIKMHVQEYAQRNSVNDLTDALVFYGENLPEKSENSTLLTKTALLDTLFNLQGAGLDTTAKTVQWLMIYMVAFPNVQRKVQDEIDQVVGSGRRVSLKDRAYLPYTEATIHEVLRKNSIVPFALPHFTIADTKLCGFDIDKGTVVFLNLHSVSFEKDFWGDPDVFRPERFLTKQNTLDSSKCHHVLSFGSGRRRCIGESLVRQEIFLVFATLMQRCRLSVTDPGDVDLSSVPSLVYGPTTCKMRVLER
ncbi:cytochrome P450 1A1-like [Mya arenaria]|uniref:cytochrome P450 1A1-like n=1 Tax=Mya arenaria TaxID=6604 RepID=UPI0022E33E09|nr:cytochrome P450 1A1-like [Mya arenaria]